MTPDETIQLMSQFLRTAGMVAIPILAACLLAGLAVGVVQAATQVNEASVSFVVKAVALIAVLVVLGPTLTAELVRYASASFRAVETVVR